MKDDAQQPDAGFVKRGFYLLAGMGVLVCVVLAILFGRPAASEAPVDSEDVKNMQASAKGWEIRYAAALSLTRIDSKNVPWDTYQEMLNENQQLKNHRVTLDGGQVVANEAAARSIVLRALMTLKEWHERHPAESPSKELAELYPLIDTLAKSPIAPIRSQAQKTQEAIKRLRT